MLLRYMFWREVIARILRPDRTAKFARHYFLATGSIIGNAIERQPQSATDLLRYRPIRHGRR